MVVEHELFELGDDVDVETLMSRIRDHVGGYPLDPAPESTPPGHDEGAASDIDVEQALARALGLVARDLRRVHLRAAMAEGWLRAETEQQAQEGQQVREQIAGLSARLDALDLRLAGLERQQVDGRDERRAAQPRAAIGADQTGRESPPPRARAGGRRGIFGGLVTRIGGAGR